MVQISTSGLLSQSVLQIKEAQAILGDLSNQLSTGKKSLNLGDYTLAESRRILDFRSVIETRTSYISVIDTVEPRLKVYDKALDSFENISNEALKLVNTTQNLDVADSEATAELLDGYIDQVEYLLKQKIGDRFLFAGTRYTTSPVSDLNALAVPPVDSVVTSPTLPIYDSAAPGSSAAAYTEDTATIDTGFSITYGVTSNDAAFQNLILGLRFAYAATQASDNSTFSTRMDSARTYLNTAITSLRNLHGEVASNIARIDDTKKLHQSFIEEMTTQIGAIQQADSAEVATKITFVQAQLQASYSATAKIASLSITNYL